MKRKPNYAKLAFAAWSSYLKNQYGDSVRVYAWGDAPQLFRKHAEVIANAVEKAVLDYNDKPCSCPRKKSTKRITSCACGEK